MSDFQKFLDESLSQIDVREMKDVDDTVLDYDIYDEVRRLVVTARDKAGLTQNQLARQTGLTQSNISNIEKGTTKPTLDTLKKMADAMGRRLIVDFADREEI